MSFYPFLGEKKGIIKCFKLKLLVRFDNPHKIKIFIQLHDILLQMSDKKGWAYDKCNSTSMILFLKYVFNVLYWLVKNCVCVHKVSSLDDGA